MSRAFFLISAILFLLSAIPARACLWDYDTLRDEKRGMPGIAEVLAGQWERHSHFFYEDRVQKMKALLEKIPDDQDAMDNLAVAQHKLGRTDEAIRVMLEKEKAFPGQYTTYSNLGTFYLLKGDLDSGIAYIQKALAINPNAHFGREEYQLKLAEFLKKVRVDPTLRDHSFVYLIIYGLAAKTAATQQATSPDMTDEDFAQLVEMNRQSNNASRLTSIGFKPNVIDGVVGMLRFGTDQSPDLYYALGDLLAFRGDKNLAYRAYQRALDLNYPRPDAVRAAMEKVREMQVPRGGMQASVIAAERAAAAIWVAEYQKFEDDLVRAGKSTDDEANFAPCYKTHGRTLKTNDVFIGDYINDGVLQRSPVAGIAVIFVVLLLVVFGMRKVFSVLRA